MKKYSEFSKEEKNKIQNANINNKINNTIDDISKIIKDNNIKSIDELNKIMKNLKT